MTSGRPARSYTVNSLDRGLAILRTVRDTDGPMRNHDVVERTGLPKATVSRLMHTLTSLGYLRRIDQGSYVLGEASARSGRAMLASLELQRYTDQFGGMLAEPLTFACLEARIAGKMVPFYRWSAQGGVHLAQGSSSTTAAAGRLAAACFEYAFGKLVSAGDTWLDQVVAQQVAEGFCTLWSADTKQLSVCAPIQHRSVGQFVLSLHLMEPCSPSSARTSVAGATVLRIAKAISEQSEVENA